MPPAELFDYYSRRAREYERVYDKPERQADLAKLGASVRSAVEGRSVLEVACGTGYWTERYAPVADSVVGLDASAEVLEVANAKAYGARRPQFVQGDAYAPDDHPAVKSATPFTGAVAAFWWSHVPLDRLATFLEALHRCLAPGTVVWVCDNRYVEGSSTPISHADDDGNTYQRRRLQDGSEHVVLKNFPTEAQLRAAVGDAAVEVEVEQLEYLWVLRYVLEGREEPSDIR